MYKIKAPDGTNNISGKNIKRLREARNVSQREFAKTMQLAGYDMDHHVIQRIESGERFITDIEIAAFAYVFHVTTDEIILARK